MGGIVYCLPNIKHQLVSLNSVLRLRVNLSDRQLSFLVKLSQCQVDQAFKLDGIQLTFSLNSLAGDDIMLLR